MPIDPGRLLSLASLVLLTAAVTACGGSDGDAFRN